MKYVYVIISLIAFFTSLSQTLTQSFNEPVVGDIDKHYRLDTSAYTSGLPLNVTGSNCNWDFTHLAGAFPFVVDSFIAPAAAPAASLFPAASYVQNRDQLYSYYKSTTSPQQTELLGGYTTSLTITFTNSGIIAGYPVSYGYNLSDPVGGNFKYNSTNGVCIGNITIAADGLGTINLPNNVSIPNVLRLKSVEILTLSIGVFPFGTFNQTIYNYYEPGKKFPILNLNYNTYQLIAGTPTLTANHYGSNAYFTVVGLKEQTLDKASYEIYPNPFHDHLTIHSGDPMTDSEFLFYDLNGRLALKTTADAEDETEKLLPGMYILEIKNKLGTLHQKVIKE